MAERGTWKMNEAAAEFYESHFVPALFADWAVRLVDAAAAARGQRVLDVACGTGVVSRTAAERVGPQGKVAAIDLNSSMLAVARRIRPGVDWREGDVSSLPFADGSFDAALCQAALMFFPDRVGALREMRRVVRPGGAIAVQVWGNSPGYEAIGEILERSSGPEVAEIFRAPFCLRDPADVAALFASAGLPDVRIDTQQGAARFPSVEAVLRTEIDGWVLRGRVDVDAILEPARERLEPFHGKDGTVSIPMEGHIAVVR